MNAVFRRYIGIMAAAVVLYGCTTMPHQPKGDGFRYVIDKAITPTQAELPGLNGGSPRLVGVVVGPDSRRDEFVVDEVVLRPRNEDDLNTFLAKYGGTVVRNGTPLLLPEVAARNPPPASSGWYLIHVNPQRSSLDDLAANMERGGSRGLHMFSSEEAARLGALMAREKVTEGR